MEAVIWIESMRIAFRQMLRHRLRSLLTVLGMIIGVAAVIVVISVGRGAKQSIAGEIEI